MRVKNTATNEIWYIRNADAGKLGRPVNIEVFDHEPVISGAAHYRGRTVDMFVCGLRPSQVAKKFLGTYLEPAP